MKTEHLNHTAEVIDLKKQFELLYVSKNLFN